METGELTVKVTVQDLLDAGLHFGHQTKRWNPKMKKYIFDARNGIYIIDLDQTHDLLIKAQKYIYETISLGRGVLFVGTKKQAVMPVKALAEKYNQPYIVNRWLGGTLTNSTTIRRSISRMRELEALEKDNGWGNLNKKEISRLRRELEKLHFNLSGIANMDQLPGALFIIDTNRESIAIKEAQRLGIPIIAIVDTNSNPDPINYPIPGNDDSIRGLQLILDITGETVEKAVGEYSRIAAEESRKRAAEEAAVEAKAKAATAARAEAAAKALAAVKEKKARAKAKEVADAKDAKEAKEAKAAEEAAPAAEAATAPVPESTPAPETTPAPGPETTEPTPAS